MIYCSYSSLKLLMYIYDKGTKMQEGCSLYPVGKGEYGVLDCVFRSKGFMRVFLFLFLFLEFGAVVVVVVV